MKTEHIRIVGGAVCFFAESSASVQWSLRVEPKYPGTIGDELRSVTDEEARSCELSK
jgi:hypothetical protein